MYFSVQRAVLAGSRYEEREEERKGECRVGTACRVTEGTGVQLAIYIEAATSPTCLAWQLPQGCRLCCATSPPHPLPLKAPSFLQRIEVEVEVKVLCKKLCCILRCLTYTRASRVCWFVGLILQLASSASTDYSVFGRLNFARQIIN